VFDNAAMAVLNGSIVWIGHEGEYEPLFHYDTHAPQDGIIIVDAQGAVITPGFVDSHTHLVFAGDRAAEFHLRRAGVSYGELLAQGRGILTTMKATRDASPEILLSLALSRLESMRSYGTTTVEVKT